MIGNIDEVENKESFISFGRVSKESYESTKRVQRELAEERGKTKRDPLAIFGGMH